jgi:hypothetical protein
MAYLYPVGVSTTALVVVGLCTFLRCKMRDAIWQLMRSE